MPKIAETKSGDAKRWEAIVRRDATADGQFWYSVKTTGVYCRPGCASRLPRRENVRFFFSSDDAERAGFRPCKKCCPAGDASNPAHVRAVAKACELIATDEHADLSTLARSVGMSRFHFHRVFRNVVGLSPKAYARARRANRVRGELSRQRSVTEAIYAAGYNSNGRFYAESSRILGMKPKNFRRGGAGSEIRFAVGECSLGSVLAAATPHGVCAILLGENPEHLIHDLQNRFPQAKLVGGDKSFERTVAKVIGFVEAPQRGFDLPLDVRGTAFQQRVWDALREIPVGGTTSYSEIARRLGAPKSVRAVARAIAANPVAVAIPCHRVLRLVGGISGYRWGVDRKRALLAREKAKKQRQNAFS